MRPVLLVLRALGLGDLLTAVPAVRGLRRAFPGHDLVLAAPPALAPLVRRIGGVDRLLPTAAYVRGPMTALPAPPRPPDLAVNLHGRGPQSHRALRALQPVRLMAFGNTEAAHDGPLWTAEEHEVRRWCRMVGHYGVRADEGDLALPVPDAVPGWAGAVVLHPGASTPDRRWPPDRFAALGRRFVADGRRVVVTGTAGEHALALAVARGAGLGPDAVLAGRTDLDALAALVAHAALVVCGDTGVAHLATAFATPSVLLFGPMAPQLWGPPAGSRVHRALWHGPDGLLDIGVDEVLEVAGDAVTAR